MPLYATELDIDGPPAETPQSDTVQLKEYQRVFPLFWEHPAIKGVTVWGYRPGHWRTAQGAPLVYSNGAEKAAMVWLKQYVANTVLPITLTSFDARKYNNKVAITWTTGTELNNDYYTIERSLDGRVYITLVTIKADPTRRGNYEVDDNNPNNGINYYRLVQYDKDGRKTYYGIRRVNFNNNKDLYVQIYPNPASASFVIRTEPDAFKNGMITIIDGFGRTVKTRALPSSGVQTIMTANFINGTYFVLINTNGTTITSKIIIRK